MKSINRENFIEIGSIVKVHGTKGEVKVSLNQDTTFKEWAFLEIREKPVPFYIEGSKHSFEEEAFLKFKGVDDMESALQLVGYSLLSLKDGIKKSGTEFGNESIIHYQIMDSKLGFLGLVDHVIENPMQTLVQTTFNKKELLIPAIKPILIKIDDKKQIIFVDLPEGLIDL